MLFRSNRKRRSYGRVKKSRPTLPMPSGSISLIDQFEAMSRSPFHNLLEKIIDSQPSNNDIRRLARKNPDRWGQMVAMFAKLSGYTEKKEIETTGIMRILHMSDAEVAREIEKLEAEDVEFTEISDQTSDDSSKK